jgi:hypothetical protein
MSCTKDQKHKNTHIISSPFMNNKESNKNVLQEILTDIIVAIRDNKTKDLDFFYIYQEIKKMCYEDNDNLLEQLSVINDILSNLFKIMSMSLGNIKLNILKSLEYLMIIFILHFNRLIINNGFSVLKSMLAICDIEYHKECLKNLTELLQVFKSKKNIIQVHAYENIINNLSTAIIILIYSTEPEVRKTFYQFINSNFDDYALIYYICYNCSNEIRLYKFYSTENIISLSDKYIKELDRHCKIIENLVKNYDKTVNTKNKIKSFFTTVGQLCKILDAFLNNNNRTYNYDKMIKSILISLKSMWIVLTHSDIMV